MIIAIGNSPSSGSTLLADLLDALPMGVRGPELNLLAVKDHYDRFETLQSGKLPVAATGCCCVQKARLNVDRLHAYGIDEPTFHRRAAEAPDFPTFVRSFFQHFARWRQKPATLFSEKTPPNIHCASRFLRDFEDGRVIHVVRHPGYVYESIRRRGYSEYQARAVWPVNVAPAYALRNHPRMITVRYEDLTADPFRAVSDLGQWLGCEVDPDQLRERYAANEYRQAHSRKAVAGWQVRETGRVADANRKPLSDEARRALDWLQGMRIGRAYARRFDLSVVRFDELVEHFGYATDVAAISQPEPYAPPRVDRRLARKWARHVVAGRMQIGDWSALQRPLEPLADATR